MSETLYLKWGTLKGWDNATERTQNLLNRYHQLGYSVSAMLQHDTPEQVEILCQIVDGIDGVIVNDWSGEEMSRDDAKAYLRKYPRDKVRAAK